MPDQKHRASHYEYAPQVLANTAGQARPKKTPPDTRYRSASYAHSPPLPSSQDDHMTLRERTAASRHRRHSQNAGHYELSDAQECLSTRLNCKAPIHTPSCLEAEKSQANHHQRNISSNLLRYHGQSIYYILHKRKEIPKLEYAARSNAWQDHQSKDAHLIL